MNETSLSLLERARGSASDETWRQVESVYASLLRKWLGRFQVEAHDAEDLVQEVLLTVSRELPRFEHSGRVGAFRSWLRTILVHRVRDLCRSRNHRPAAVGGSTWAEQFERLADESSDLSRLWNDEHDQHVLAQLMDQVRPRFEATTWEAFHRQVFDGQRADVVAAELGLSLNSVYVARSRVLGLLRREADGLIDDL